VAGALRTLVAVDDRRRAVQGTTRIVKRHGTRPKFPVNMSVQSATEEQLLAETLERAGTPLSTRERLAEALVGGAFIAAALALWLIQPPSAFAIAPAVLCVVVLALSMLVRFELPLGFTVPAQLAFVPLLFVVPPALVPPAAVLAFVLAGLPQVVQRRMRAGRLLHSIGNSWFAIGPAAVFAIAGVAPWKAGAGLLLLALGAQFAGDLLASVIRHRVGEETGLREQLGETAWVYGVDACLSPVALAIAEQVRDHRHLAVVAGVPLLALFHLFARERHERLNAMLELSGAYRGTALVLGDVVEADDGYTGEHCKSVVALALDVAEHLELDADQRRNLEFGALLHDVGKVAIPKEIINKPGKLSPAEWTVIKTHTVEGQKMLDRVGGFMREVGRIVRSHHERWDGGGYPDGVAGEAIPLEARIVACCDTWNAMRTDRSYRAALPHDVAVSELRSNAGSQFDPRVVEALLAVVGDAAGTAGLGELKPAA
jgi:putative nucleotidyltransferase with HDIG domain